MFCMKCGKALSLDDGGQLQHRFCLACGAPIPDSKTDEAKTEDVKTEAETGAIQNEPIQTEPEGIKTDTDESIMAPKTDDVAALRRKRIRKIGIRITVLAGVLLLGIFIALVSLTDLKDFFFERLPFLNQNTVTQEDQPYDLERLGEAFQVSDGESLTFEDAVQVTFSNGSLPQGATLYFGRAESDDGETRFAYPLYDLVMDTLIEGNIEVSLALPDDLKSEDPDNIIVGILVESRTYSTHLSNHEQEDFIFVVPQRVEAGFAVLSIQPDYFTEVRTGQARQSKGTVHAAGGKTYRMRLGYFSSEVWYEGGRFRVVNERIVGSLNRESGQALLDDLEQVYNDFLQKNYVYDLRTQYPFYVYLKKMSDEGGYVLSKSAYLLGKHPDRGWIELNRSHFDQGYQRGQVLPLIAHEWFHFVQNNYTQSSNTYWFDEATATYYEGVYDGGATPSIVSEYWQLAFDGIYPNKNTGEEGYARQPLIDFAVKRFDEGWILRVYEAIKSGTDLEQAIANESGGSVANIINPYYVAMLSGEVGVFNTITYYNGIRDQDEGFRDFGSLVTLSKPSLQQSGTDTDSAGGKIELAKQTVTVKGQSPQVIALDFDEDLVAFMNDASQLSVTAEGGVNVNLVRFRSRDTQVDLGISDTITASNVKPLLEDSWKYLVLLVNAGSLDTEVELTIELQSVPSMDELSGVWSDTVMTITDFYASPEFIAMFGDMLYEMFAGCEMEGEGDFSVDPDEPIDFDDMVGQTQTVTMEIQKVTDTSGIFIVHEGDDDDMSFDDLPFTYTDGKLYATLSQEGAAMVFDVDAFYVSDTHVGVHGSYTIDYMNGMLRIALNIRGEKAIERP